jgi:hypothetical protein
LRFKTVLASLTLAISCVAVAQTPAGNLTKAFVGRWAGQVQTQYPSNRQVIDPIWLTISQSPDQKSLELDAIPYNSSGLAAHWSNLITFNRDTAKVTFSTNGKPLYRPGTYDVQGLKEFEKEGRGTLVLTGVDTENGELVDVRIVLAVHRNLYTYSKKSQKHNSDGHVSTFYETYTFTRNSPIPKKGKPLTSAAQSPVQTSESSQIHDINAKFIGDWVGHVTYPDANGALKMDPAYLKVEEVRHGKTLRMDFTFEDSGDPELDDHSRRFITIMPDSSELKLEWDNPHLSVDHTFHLDGLNNFTTTGYGTLIFTGTMKEAGVMTDLRYTLILKEGLLVYQRETKPEGKQQFETRNRYLFTRADSPRN